MSSEFKKYKVLGYTTDFNQCDCCGREDLKGTIAMLDIDNDVVVHFGTGCAASADKYDSLEAARIAKREVNAVLRQHKESVNFAIIRAWKCIRSIYKVKDHTQLDQSIWKPIVNDFIAFYTNPDNKFKAHPLLKAINTPAIAQ